MSRFVLSPHHLFSTSWVALSLCITTIHCNVRAFSPRPEATIVYKQRYMYLGGSLMPIWFNHRSKFPTWAYDLPRPWLVADFLILSTLTPSMGLTSDPIKGQLVTSSAAKPRLHRWVYLACRPASGSRSSGGQVP